MASYFYATVHLLEINLLLLRLKVKVKNTQARGEMDYGGRTYLNYKDSSVKYGPLRQKKVRG